MQRTSTKLDEEQRALLRKIIESMAWRQLASMNILGHCIKYVTKVDSKVLVAEELHTSLILFREVRALHRELGWSDIESAVREKLDRMPNPASRLEFGISHYLTVQSEVVAMGTYVDCVSAEFAAIARSYVENSSQLVPSGDPLFEEYCREPGNRAHAQSLFNRWFLSALGSYGRPGSRGDKRAVELGLRNASAGEMIEAYVASIRDYRERCGLQIPELASDDPRTRWAADAR